VVIAKTLSAQSNLIRQFKERKVRKVYKAVCSGNIAGSEGLIDVPVGRPAGGRIRAGAFGRLAITRYKILKKTERYFFVKLMPETGRTNQLRVHMAWLGCPILGDITYKAKPWERVMLHAESLAFIHPATNKKITFKVPCPKEFSVCWGKLTGKKKI
jgi:23S rRNA pseudouridine1911/1915/1917 synthase